MSGASEALEHARPAAALAPPLGRLLAHTPMRDLLRGRLSGRLDWRRALETAALPPTVRDALLQTAARLPRRREFRAEVVRELAAACVEALAQGLSEADCIRVLTDSPRVVRLARRGAAAALFLPDDLSTCVEQVVRRARLLRGERAELARELAAHFHDALAAGRTPAEAARDFGDLRRAARLIGRARRRTRPLAARLRVRAGQAILALTATFALAYAGLAVRLELVSADVSHDYWAELNRGAAEVSEDQRAWPIYRQAAARLVAPERRGVDDERPVPPMPTYFDPDAGWPDGQEWQDLCAYVERNQAALDLFRAAAGRPRLGMLLGTRIEDALEPEPAPRPGIDRARDVPPVPRNPPLLAAVVPHLSPMRRGAELLALDALRAARAGDGQRAASNVAAIVQIAAHAGETPFVIADLCSFAILQRAHDAVNLILAERPDVLNDAQLSSLAHRLAAFRGGGRMQVRFTGERLTFADLVQRLYAADGLPAPGFWDALASIVDSPTSRDSTARWLATNALAPLQAAVATRSEIVAEFDRLMTLIEAEAALPLWERREARSEAEIASLWASPWRRLRYRPLAVSLQSYWACGLLSEYATQRRDATLVTIALELYRRRHGQYPQALDLLAPDLLPTIPLDRYDGRPIKYRLADGTPRLYSVGVDRDDDGGREPVPTPRDRAPGRRLAAEWCSPADAATRPVPDGDWVLWPPPGRTPVRPGFAPRW